MSPAVDHGFALNHLHHDHLFLDHHLHHHH
jgi:hypothetical protein